MAKVIIPITQGLNQAMTCTLPVNGGNITLTFGFTYNTPGGYWFVSISDGNNNLLIDGLPLVVGSPVYDILAQYQYLGIGSAYVVPNGSGLPDIPDYNTLGTSTTNTNSPSFSLVWADNFSYVT